MTKLGKAIISLTAIIIFLVAVLSCFFYVANIYTNDLEIINVDYVNKKVPDSFNGYKIALIADFHSRKDYKKIVDGVINSNVDIIIIAGDFFDRLTEDKDYISIDFMDELLKIAPIYYISGNHEARMDSYINKYRPLFKEKGVKFLENKKIYLEKDGQKISLSGIHDPEFYTKKASKFTGYYGAKAKNLDLDGNMLNICVCHRPDYYKVFAQYNVDLMLAGHLHGGQIAFNNKAIFTMKEKFFPKVVSGFYYEESLTVYISKGLGVSHKIPFRINVKPELSIITLSNNI